MLRAQLLALCSRLSLPTDPYRDPRPRWDGRTLATTGLAPDTLAHEMAHWMRCPPRRRHLPDFGLGLGPESLWVPRLRAIVGWRTVQREEEETAMLDVCMRRSLELDPDEREARTRWGEADQRRVPSTMRALNRRGLLRGAVPVCLLPPLVIE